MPFITISLATFLQLCRMRVLWVILVFALVMIGLNLLEVESLLGPEYEGVQQLSLLKNSASGLLRLLGVVLAVSCSALLIPKDLEDRITYTFLYRAVSRSEYVLAKYCGVALLLTVVMVAMSLVFEGVLYFRTQEVLQQQQQILSTMGMPAGDMQFILARIASQGPSWNLQYALGCLLMECLVLSALTLLLSTISRSQIFSGIAAACLYFMGLFQNDLQKMLKLDQHMQESAWMSFSVHLSNWFVPNFQQFGVVEELINDQSMPFGDFAWLAGIAAFYIVSYLLIACYSFTRREL